MIVVNTATEDELSEVVAEKLIRQIVPDGTIGLALRRGGVGYLKSSFDKFRQMARREYILLLTDLDRQVCAPSLIANWTNNQPIPDKLLFRIPVREIEAWLLADRQGMAKFLGISESKLPPNPDTLLDPKQTLLNVARHATRDVRIDLIASRDALAAQGLGYNRLLTQYVENLWDINRATLCSPSLLRTVNCLSKLT